MFCRLSMKNSRWAQDAVLAFAMRSNILTDFEHTDFAIYFKNMSSEVLSSCDLCSQFPDVSPFEVYVTSMSALQPWGILYGHTVEFQVTLYPYLLQCKLCEKCKLQDSTRPAVNQTVVLSQVPAMK